MLPTAPERNDLQQQSSSGRLEMVSAIRGELLEILASCERTFVTGRPTQQEDLHDGHIIVVGLLAKTGDTFAACHMLIEKGLFEPLQALARLLTEDAFRILYFAHHSADIDALTYNFKYTTANELLKLGEVAAQHGVSGADEDVASAKAEIAAIEKGAAKKGITPTRWPTVRAMAEGVGKSPRYWYYKRASQSLHTSLVALGSHMKEVENGRFVIERTVTENQFVVTGMLVADTFMSAVIAGAVMLKWDTANTIIEARKHVDKRLQELAQRAGPEPEA